MKFKLGRMRGLSFGAFLSLSAMTGCATYPDISKLDQNTGSPTYLIGPGDSLQVFVYNNSDLSTTVPVRPDGQVTLPLVPSLPVAGLTATQAADKIQTALSNYVKKPSVSVMVVAFHGPLNQQIRVIGDAVKPQTFPYVQGMTIMDVLIQSGGLSQFADGNRAILMRRNGNQTVKYRVRLDDLIKDGDLSANAPVLPGDILVIPQSWF
jgi:polysaccharide export outer membrane protein